MSVGFFLLLLFISSLSSVFARILNYLLTFEISASKCNRTKRNGCGLYCITQVDRERYRHNKRNSFDKYKKITNISVGWVSSCFGLQKSPLYSLTTVIFL